MILVQKHIYLISDFKMIYLMTWDSLFVLVLFKNYVHSIMLGLDAVLMWGNYFRHNSHQAAIIILVILYLACVFLLILYNNHVYIVFTAVLVGLHKKLILVIYVSNYLFFPNYNIVFQF